MSNMTIVGAQWGDEGKGKIVDLLTSEVDMVVRFQGGNNAGHTVIVDGQKYVLHVVPSGILHPGKMCVIGNGVVLDPESFLEEIDALQSLGLDVSPERLKISYKTHLIMPYHRRHRRRARRQCEVQDRHHRPRHRPLLRRQEGPCGRARRRSDRSRGAARQRLSTPSRKRTCSSRSSTACPRWILKPCSTISWPLRRALCPIWPTCRASSSTPTPPARASCLRARRASCSTSITAPIPL